MWSFRNVSIRRKLTLISMGTASVALLIACAAFVGEEVLIFRQGLVRKVQVLAEVIGTNNQAALAFGDPENAWEILDALRAEEHVEGACIYTAEGAVFSVYRRDESFEPPPPEAPGHRFAEGRLGLFHEIVHGDERLGTLYIQADLGEIYARLARYGLTVIAVFCGATIVAFLLSAKLQRLISQPILSLARITKIVSHDQDFSVRAVKESDDELGMLMDGFNGMLKQIQRRDDELARHRARLEELVAERTRELEIKTEEAMAASRAKSEFLANMSHELRTPLHGILSYARFGIDEAESAEREQLRDFFQEVEASGRELLVLLNDLLDLAKLESGRMHFAFQEADLHLTIHAVILELQALAAEREVEIRYPEPTFDTASVFDPAKIKQVMRNLVANAIKFSPDGGVVEIEHRRQGDLVRVRVLDRGPGVPETEREAIFDKFIQSSKTRSGAGGTGLGLAISREIVAAHEGRIWVENRPEGGAVFTVELPVQPDPATADAELIEATT